MFWGPSGKQGCLQIPRVRKFPDQQQRLVQLLILGFETGGCWNEGAMRPVRDLIRVRAQAQRAPAAFCSSVASAWAAGCHHVLGRAWPAPARLSQPFWLKPFWLKRNWLKLLGSRCLLQKVNATFGTTMLHLLVADKSVSLLV